MTPFIYSTLPFSTFKNKCFLKKMELKESDVLIVWIFNSEYDMHSWCQWVVFLLRGPPMVWGKAIGAFNCCFVTPWPAYFSLWVNICLNLWPSSVLILQATSETHFSITVLAIQNNDSKTLFFFLLLCEFFKPRFLLLLLARVGKKRSYRSILFNLY